MKSGKIQTDFGGKIKIIQVYMSVMMLQTKCKLNNTELFLKLLHIQSKETGNNKCHEETAELA